MSSVVSSNSLPYSLSLSVNGGPSFLGGKPNEKFGKTGALQGARNLAKFYFKFRSNMGQYNSPIINNNTTMFKVP